MNANLQLKKPAAGLGIIAAAIAAIAFIGLKDAGGDNGGGGPGNASAAPAGSLGTVTLSQDVTKGLTDSIRVDARITFGTKDFQGNPVNWPYKVSWVLVNDKTNTIIGTTGFESGAAGFAPGTQDYFSTFTPINKVFAGDRLRVDLILEASPTDSAGRPLYPQWKSMAGGVSANRVLIATPSTLQVVSGPKLFRIFPGFSDMTYTWTATVKNNGNTVQYYRMARTETSPEFGGPFTRRQSVRSVAPGQTHVSSSNTSTGATRITGHAWVEATDSAGNLIQELPPRVAYTVVK